MIAYVYNIYQVSRALNILIMVARLCNVCIFRLHVHFIDSLNMVITQLGYVRTTHIFHMHVHIMDSGGFAIV